MFKKYDKKRSERPFIRFHSIFGKTNQNHVLKYCLKIKKKNCKCVMINNFKYNET